MTFIVLLDSGPLGLVTHPKAGLEADACKQWLRDLPRQGHLALVPEIIDYETRREMLRGSSSNALSRLDALKAFGNYLPLTTQAMLQAADFWASARLRGIPLADRLALDADVILCAQAATLLPSFWSMPNASIVIATMNVAHLSQFADARPWQSIL